LEGDEMKTRVFVSGIVLALFLSGEAYASVVTLDFEGLPVGNLSSYGGLNWSNANIAMSGSNHFVENANNIPFIFITSPSISLNFNFVSAEVAWLEGTSPLLYVAGYRSDGSLKGKSVLDGTLINGNFTPIDFTTGNVSGDFQNINKLVIYSLSGDGITFALDKVAGNVVPIPGTLLLLGTGLLGVLGIRRRLLANFRRR
jgi:hypothetical protein